MKAFSLLIALMTVSLFAPQESHAGDRVGNGGGVWACTLPNGQYQTAMLVDLFEARSEFQLVVQDPALAQTPNEIYNARKVWLAQNLPQVSSLLTPYFARVEANLVMVDAALAVIDDSNFRVMPLATDCLAGRWDYIQFANFTAYDRTLVRKDIWEGAALPNLDKSALLFHEAIYLMLRERDHDTNSVRARAATGLLFANLPIAEISARVADILKAESVPPQPPTGAPKNSSPNMPIIGWVCSLRNKTTSHTFWSGGTIQIDAEYGVNRLCEDNSGSYIDACSVTTECAPTQTRAETTGCMIKNKTTGHSFLGKGVNTVHAKALGMQACEDASGGYIGGCAVVSCSN